jgi:5-oxoprolinase (ATP-hydrolysing)
MNNLTFGDKNFGYYETICGGAGAGPGYNGAHCVHTHMTNTRITDVEVFESRFPVQIQTFQIRKNSGGRGKFKGGDGVIRIFKFNSDLNCCLLTQRRETKPYGLKGGESGLAGRNVFREGGKEEGEEIGGMV